MNKIIISTRILEEVVMHFKTDPRFKVLEDKENNFLESPHCFFHDTKLQSKNLNLVYRKEIFIEGFTGEEEHEYLAMIKNNGKLESEFSYVSNHGYYSTTSANNLKNEIKKNA